jgi:beta-galactosidase
MLMFSRPAPCWQFPGVLALCTLLATGVGAASPRSSAPGYLRYPDYAGTPYNVSYDKRSLLINGERSYFASVGIHYPRFTPGQWDDVILKAKNDGYNMIQTYFFHNAHQPKLSQWPWNMEGPSNLTLFLQKAADAGMFVDLRIGPYVCAEWSWGGYPYDLANVAGLVSRTDNPAWEAYMRAVVLNVTREFRGFFADRGGPIALGQVENELHTSVQQYVDWCGELAEETGVKIPWGMCNGNSASSTINTCNGGDCVRFIEENGQNGRVLVDQPALWTENWMGWFDDWGQSFPAGDWTTFESTEQSASKAYGILRWTARGGSHVNFYNWAGGNHFARNAGSSMVNYYYWKAPIAPDNIAQGPERDHMARLYAAIRAVAAVVLSDEAQLHKQANLSGHAAAFVYRSGADTVVFLENQGMSKTIVWEGKSYSVPGSSTTILKNGAPVFNSADVRSDGSAHTWSATSLAPLSWRSYADPSIVRAAAELPAPSPPYSAWAGSALGRVVRAGAPMEQVNFSEYDSELLLYSRAVSAAELGAATTGGRRSGAASVASL